jgi:hypothetical protein
MNLQESIRRILREDEYSPAGKEIIPNKIVIHKSNPKVRDRISNEGLKVRAGECYKIYAGYGEKCIPAIFATNSTNKRSWFDSTYDDDVWEINTELIPDVKWYKDRHYESTKKHIVTFDNIPPEAIELIHEGTGKDWGLMESNDKLIKETKTFQDIINKTLSEIKNICSDEDNDTFPDWFSGNDCEGYDTIDKITIVNIEKRNGVSPFPMFEVDVNLELNGIWGGIDYEDFMYLISDRIVGKWKTRFIFNIIEQNNINRREMREGTGDNMIRETKTFQDIINKTLNEIKNICGDEDDDTFPDWLSDDDCSVADSIDKITILNVEKRTNMDRTTFFKVDVNIGFNSIFRWIDYDDLMYRIANRIIGKWKIRFIFNIKEQDNSNKGEMWESGKHKNINESKFFQRRIDLDEVKELLLVNAQQIFYETKSYEQFKYELTLRAVESIMYSEYGMGYEDLPEQEEIKFVTEVSDMFNNIIIDLYKSIRGNM